MAPPQNLSHHERDLSLFKKLLGVAIRRMPLCPGGRHRKHAFASSCCRRKLRAGASLVSSCLSPCTLQKLCPQVRKVPHGTGHCVFFHGNVDRLDGPSPSQELFLRKPVIQGCDVLAKNDRGHTPFALCTDPDVRCGIIRQDRNFVISACAFSRCWIRVQVQQLLQNAMNATACKAAFGCLTSFFLIGQVHFSRKALSVRCMWSIRSICTHGKGRCSNYGWDHLFSHSICLWRSACMPSLNCISANAAFAEQGM